MRLNSSRFYSFTAALTVLLAGNLIWAEPASNAAAKVKASYGSIPLSFEANRGQTAPLVEFLARTSTHTVLLEPTASVLIGKKSVVRTVIVGGNPSAHIGAGDPQSGSSNYLIGRDAKKWITDVPHFGRVEYSNVYPGVNLTYYGNGRRLEYDWVIAPGADSKLIRARYEGVQSIRTAPNGDLILKTSDGELRHEKPVVYQTIAGRRQTIDARYVLRAGNEVSFKIGKYDHAKTLVIDPILAYSSYLGGSSWDAGYGVAVDGGGSAYVVGGTSSVEFPKVNQFQSFNSGTLCSIGGDESQLAQPEPCSDMFVTKINPAGTAIVYSTFIGGSADETAFSVALDSNCSSNCNAYVTGRTHSTASFPITAGAYQSQNKGAQDSVVLKLNPAGNGLVFATFLGGENDDKASSIAVDTSGVYVTGQTLSTQFPVKNALYPNYGGNSATACTPRCWDGFITKLTLDGTSLIYSTYIGGPSSDEPRGIGVDAARNAYITGRTQGNYPLKNAFQSTVGKTSAFVTSINSAGNALNYSTYLGGDDYDYADAIAVASDGTVYIGGITNSPTHWGGRAFPVTSGAYRTIRKSCTASSCPGSGDGFVAKLSPQGSLLASTVFGGAITNDPSHYPESKAWGVSFDQNGYIYASGYTDVLDFPTVKGLQITNAGQHDVVILKFDPNCQQLLFSTYFGGTQDDWGWGIATDAKGGIYVTGYTSLPDPSKPFPNTTPGHAVIQPTYGGGRFDAFIVKLANADLVLVPKSIQGNPAAPAPQFQDGKEGERSAAVASAAAVYDPSVGLTITNTILNQSSASSTDGADNPVLAGLPPGTLTNCVYGPSNASCLGSNNTVAFPPGTTIPVGTGLDVTTTIQLSNPPPIGARLIFNLKTLSDTNDPDPSNNIYGYNLLVGTPFTVNTSPQGLNVSIDGGAATPAPVATALDGSVPHTICAITPQNGYVFSRWADGTTSNCLNNVTLTPNAVYNANFSACSYSLPAGSANVGSSAGSLTVNVTATGGCAWTATPNASWLRVASYNGTASVTFSYDANTSQGSRSATPLIANQPFTLTQAGATVAPPPVPRDFRGISRSDVLIYDPVLGTEATALSNGSGGYSYVPSLYSPNFDTLRTGDYNGDGKADLIVYNSSTGLAYLGNSNGAGSFGFSSLFWSPGYDTVLIGDLNGDGKADVMLYNKTTGTAFTATSNGAGFNYKFVFISSGFTHLKLADFNGDGRADLLVYNRNTGNSYLGFSDGNGSFSFSQIFLSPGYDKVEVGDFNNDKKMDLLLYRSSDGYLSTGLSTGTSSGFNFHSISVSSGFTTARVADYNGDGSADLILYNSNTAATYLGIGNGAGGFAFSGLFWSPGFDNVIAQDANGDGKSDLILYNSTSGTAYTAIGNGSGFTYTYSYWGTNRILAQ